MCTCSRIDRFFLMVHRLVRVDILSGPLFEKDVGILGDFTFFKIRGMSVFLSRCFKKIIGNCPSDESQKTWKHPPELYDFDRYTVTSSSFSSSVTACWSLADILCWFLADTPSRLYASDDQNETDYLRLDGIIEWIFYIQFSPYDSHTKFSTSIKSPNNCLYCSFHHCYRCCTATSIFIWFNCVLFWFPQSFKSVE